MTAPPPPAVAELVERVRDACGVVLSNEVAAALERLSTELESLRSQSERLVQDKEALAREEVVERAARSWFALRCSDHANATSVPEWCADFALRLLRERSSKA